MGMPVDAHLFAPLSLLRLYDAAREPGLDGRHIQAWMDFEHEATRQGFPVEIERDDLKALIEVSEIASRRRGQIGAGECDATGGTR